MSERFDWRTDEEDWADEPVVVAREATAVSRPFAWKKAALVFILFAVATGIVYWQLGKRAKATQEAITTEIELTHELVRQADAAQDEELFWSFLSGRDPAWMEWQNELAKEGRLYDRSAVGLVAQPDVQHTQVEMSADLDAAEVTFEQAYDVQNAAGVTETVWLQQTAVYRRGAHWLFAPPNAEFWGDWLSWDGAHLGIVYHRRDEAIVARLAADLAALIDDVCQMPDMACADDIRVYVRLDDSPESLLQTADAMDLLKQEASGDLPTSTQNLLFNLPTPTLVGLPLDEAGYHALWRGYGRHVAAAIIVAQADYECCHHVLLNSALLEWQLHQLDLAPWPLTTADYDQRFYGNLHIEDFNNNWYEADDRPADRQLTYMLAQFLGSDITNLSPIAIQRSIEENSIFSSWSQQIAGDTFAAELWGFLIGQTTSGQLAEPPLPLPKEDILYVCDGTRLERYDFDGAQLSFPTIDVDSKPMYFNLRPFGQNYLVEEHFFNVDGQDTLTVKWVDDNGAHLIFDSTNGERSADHIFLSMISPDSRYLVIGYISDNNEQIDLFLLDTDDCDNDGCQMYPVPDWPLWSPSGERMLWQERANAADFTDPAPLLIADARGQNATQIADDIYSPFWLDEQTIGYVRDDGAEQTIVARQLDTTVEENIVRRSDLRALLPDIASAEPLNIEFVEASPTNPNLLLITARNNEEINTPAWHFLFDRNDETSLSLTEGDLTEQYSSRIYSSTSFSANGRFLVTVGGDPASSSYNGFTDIVNLETKQKYHLLSQNPWGNYNWSPDNQWLVQPYDQYLLLLALESNYQYILPGNFAGCFFNSIWVPE